VSGTPDRRAAAISRLRWIVPGIALSVAVIVGLELAVRQWPQARQLQTLIPLLAVIGFAVLLYGNWIRRDRKALLSVLLPAIALALLSAVVPRPWNAILIAASSGLVLAIAWSRRAFAWWTVHVLRRPPVTPEQIFRGELRADLIEWTEALGGAGDLTPRARRRAADTIAHMRSLRAPDLVLAAIRDDLANLAERWVATPRDESEARAYADMRDELVRITDRHRATAAG
jgi:hypothetical protein